MRWNASARLLLALTMALSAAAGCGSAARAEGPPKPVPAPSQAKAKDCIEVKGEASYASVGYDHLVHVTSRCAKRMSCSVKTNVNPEPATIELAPNDTQTVVTWRGSPAREFTPIVSCSER